MLVFFFHKYKWLILTDIEAGNLITNIPNKPQHTVYIEMILLFVYDQFSIWGIYTIAFFRTFKLFTHISCDHC